MRFLFGAYVILPRRGEALVMTNLTPHLFWITSRAAGFAALILASLAVSLGLLMSTKLVKRRRSDLISFHEVLSLSTIVAIVVHAVTLLGDAYLHPSVADISLPFVSSYRTAWMSIGIVGGWSLVLLGLSYYFRARIGAARWRKLHRFTALAWLAGLVHALGMGTDAGQAWFLAMIAVVVIPALGLLAIRLGRVGAASPAPTPRAGAGPSSGGPRSLRGSAAAGGPAANGGDLRGISVGVVPARGVPVGR
jgi:sulfoxide reductase heme-binding subunit YedZ